MKQPALRAQQNVPSCYNTVDGSTTDTVPETMLVYFDGGCAPNPGKMSACVVICPPIGKPQIHTLTNLGHGTNNIAEWSALVLAVTLLHDSKEQITILGDSQLVVNQANGVWRIKDTNLQMFWREYYKYAQSMNLEVKYVPRERNLAGRYLEHGFI